MLTKAWVRLTEERRNKLREGIGNRTYHQVEDELDLMSNLRYVFKRYKSIPLDDYQKITGETVEPDRVDGTYFRQTAELYKILTGSSFSKLHSDFFPGKKMDNKPFNGNRKNIDFWLQKAMEEKFFQAGFSLEDIKQGIGQIVQMQEPQKVSFKEILSLVQNLKSRTGLSYEYLINDPISRFLSGRRKNISGEYYENLLALEKKVEDLETNGRNIEEFKDQILGRTDKYVFFYRLEDKLRFLERNGVNPRNYIRTSIESYKARSKKVGLAKAKVIVDDYNRLFDVWKNEVQKIANILVPYSEVVLRINHIKSQFVELEYTSDSIEYLVKNRKSMKIILQKEVDPVWAEEYFGNHIKEAMQLTGLSEQQKNLCISHYNNYVLIMCRNEPKEDFCNFLQAYGSFLEGVW